MEIPGVHRQDTILFLRRPKQYGSPKDFDIFIREIIVNAGSEMLVAVAGKMMRMPGLPKMPQAERIDVVNGEIVGLS